MHIFSKFKEQILTIINLKIGLLLALPNLLGITPLEVEDLAGKYFRADYNDFIYFDQNGTAVETDEEGKTATYKWSVENRVIKLSGNNNYIGVPFTFNKYIFVFDNEYKVLVFDVKNNKLVAATPDIEEFQ